jgi:hypothetical protein
MLSEIKEKLINNPQHIENILEDYGFCNIDIRSKEIRCGIEEDTNKSSIRIKLVKNDYLYVTDYGRGINCDFFSFIIKSKNVDYKDVINTVKKELGIEYLSYTKKKSIFGGFYDKIKVNRLSTIELNYYNETILISYMNKFNMKFIADGISISTQRKFNIGFDVISQRITCPWWSFDCRLVGITGRYNGDYEEDNTLKWFPVIPHPKSQTLYGYIENYQYLQGCDELYIGESEKFPMQLDSMEIYTGLALGGNSIHAPQIIHIINLNPKKIIFGYDEGLDEDIIMNQIKKVKSMIKFFDIKVGYIIDRENKILPKESKMSPTDLGKENFLELKNNFVEWV